MEKDSMSQVEKSIVPQITPGVKIIIVKHPYHICNGKRVNLTALQKYQMKDINGKMKIRRLHRCKACNNIFMPLNEYMQIRHKYENYNFILSDDIIQADMLKSLKSKKKTAKDQRAQPVEIGRTIYRGVKTGHKCVSDNFKLVPFKASLINNDGNIRELSLRKCNRCGKIFIEQSLYNKKAEHFRNNYVFKSAQYGNQIVSVNNKINILKVSVPKKKVVDPKDFLTRTQIFHCSKKGHKIHDITATIKILNSTGKIEEVEFPAAYCETCKKYYILESEFQKLKRRGIIVCKVVENEFWNNLENTNPYNLNQESTLHILGYNVNSVANLSTAQRWAILEIVVDEKILSKVEICSHLDYLISRSRTRKNFASAISKWKEDRAHIANYNCSGTKVEVKTINRNVYR